MNGSSAFLGRPVRSLQTMLRLISMTIPEIPPVIPDGVYGMSTMRSVTALQRYLRLPATGVVDLATWNEIIVLYYDAVEELLPPQATRVNTITMAMTNAVNFFFIFRNSFKKICKQNLLYKKAVPPNAEPLCCITTVIRMLASLAYKNTFLPVLLPAGIPESSLPG